MNKITLIFTYYNSPQMLRKQMDYWQDYPEGVKIIVIDDGSKNFCAKDVINERRIDVELYRIKQDIFQNTMGARNLGFTVAPEGWVFNLDIDHVVPAECITALINYMGFMNRDCYYMPARYRMESLSESEKIHRHSDTFIITRGMFWFTGGYDEDFVKYYYNGAASMFRKVLEKRLKRVELEQIWTLYFSPFVIEDASPIQKRNRKQGHSIEEIPTNHLRFEWEKVTLQQDYMRIRKDKKDHLVKSILNNINYDEYKREYLEQIPDSELQDISDSLSLVP